MVFVPKERESAVSSPNCTIPVVLKVVAEVIVPPALKLMLPAFEVSKRVLIVTAPEKVVSVPFVRVTVVADRSESTVRFPAVLSSSISEYVVVLFGVKFWSVVPLKMIFPVPDQVPESSKSPPIKLLLVPAVKVALLFRFPCIVSSVGTVNVPVVNSRLLKVTYSFRLISKEGAAEGDPVSLNFTVPSAP